MNKKYLLNIFLTLIILFLLIFVVNSYLFSKFGTANPQICSFNDESTGFYASWHSNCSGFVTFIINMRNFPRIDDFPDNIFFGNSLFGQHFWIGIGFRLISTELAIIENLSGSFVSVSPARFDPGRPPTKEYGGGGILINPKGTFIDSTIIATFSIDESFFGEECLELLFFTRLTPINTPYVGIPYSKTICDLTRICSRFKCSEYGPMPFSGILPSMDYLNNNFEQFISPLPQQQQIYSSPKYIPYNYLNNNLNNIPLNNYQNNPIFESFSQQYLLNKNNCPQFNQRIPFSNKSLKKYKKQLLLNKRQISLKLQNNSLKGTAYEGQDKLFPKIENKIPVNNLQQFNQDDNNKLFKENDLSKCDGGIDPYWCKDYIKQFILGIEGKRDKINPCQAIIESLKKSNHQCCNEIQRMNC